MRKTILIVITLLFVLGVPAFAGPAPSKTAANQSIEERAADLAIVQSIVENEQVATALASHGFTQEQVNQKLAQMSQQDLHQLARNLDQLQAAGLTRQEWLWILIGAVAALIIIIALTK